MLDSENQRFSARARFACHNRLTLTPGIRPLCPVSDAAAGGFFALSSLLATPISDITYHITYSVRQALSTGPPTPCSFKAVVGVAQHCA